MIGAPSARPRGALLMDPATLPLIVGPGIAARLESLLTIDTSRVDSLDDLVSIGSGDLDVLITGWGAPRLDEHVLDRLPSLRAIVHWGGAVDFIDPSAWSRGIRITSAGWANAIPVAEYTIALITLAAKDAFWAARTYSAEQREIQREIELPHVGLYRRTIGIVGASQIGARVAERLRSFDVEVLLYDPTCTEERASGLGATLVPELTELAARSAILSLHAPALPSTTGMISRSVLAAMPDGATLVNTARGSLVEQDALVAELASGRLRAVLDVTEPDVLPPGHPLYTLPSAFVTPHLAGSAGTELARLAEAAVAEVELFLRGEPPRFPAPRPVA